MRENPSPSSSFEETKTQERPDQFLTYGKSGSRQVSEAFLDYALNAKNQVLYNMQRPSLPLNLTRKTQQTVKRRLEALTGVVRSLRDRLHERDGTAEKLQPDGL